MILCRVSVSYGNKDSWSNGHYLRLLTGRSRVRILAWAGLFIFFFYQNETKGEEICGNESLGEIELQIDFNK